MHAFKDVVLLCLAGMLGLLIPFQAEAQRNLPLGRDNYFRIDSRLNQTALNLHSNIKPMLLSEVGQAMDADSLMELGLLWPGFSKMFGEDSATGPSISIWATPTFLLEPGFQSNDTASGGLFRSGVGFNLGVEAGERFAGQFSHLTANGSYADYLYNYADSRKVIPGEGYAYGTSLGKHNKITTFNLSYLASKNFNFQFGHGKNFWGDGYRSLLLSDVANNYTYFKGVGSIWKVKYVVLYANLKDINVPSGNHWRDFDNKYTTAHYLSYNATKWLNVSLFEAVVWQAKDTLHNRGYDMAYLNPVIFFRPVEYSRGSPDNSLIGASGKIMPHKKVQLYGQVVLDEFLLAEVRAGNGWWANKQGLQLGAKYFDAFGVKGLHFQGEWNKVRPFTYSHSPSIQNWGHFNQPLAHPLGANFSELLAFVRYERPKWSIEAKIMLADYGIDSVATSSVGQDVYRSYLSNQAVYGHYTGQGVPVDLNINQLKATFRLLPDLNMIGEVGVTNRNQTIDGVRHTTNFITVGVRTALNEFYSDF